MISRRAGPDIRSYDHITVAFFGGRDSLASLLIVLETGYRRFANKMGRHTAPQFVARASTNTQPIGNP
jgi:hypothetical protein